MTGQELKKQKESKGITDYELYRFHGLSYASISRIETDGNYTKKSMDKYLKAIGL